MEKVVEQVLDSLLALLCVGELGVDTEMDLLISVSVWLSVDFHFWSLVAARWVSTGP